MSVFSPRTPSPIPFPIPRYDSSQDDGKAVLPTQSTHMLTYTFTNGAVMTFRTSGTEPKLKYYIEATAATRDAAQTKVKSIADLALTEMLEQ